MPLARAISALINQRTGLAVAHVLPVRQMPKTTSGKLQRAQLARDYAQGVFADIVEKMDALTRAAPADNDASADEDTDLSRALKAICDKVVPERDLGFNDDLFESGLSSLDLAQIHEGIEQRWPGRLDVTDLFEYPTISALAAYLEEEVTAA